MNIYEIRIRSLLALTWQATFDVEAFTHDTKQGETRLRSELDQAQLLGILNRIHDMGLTLLAVNLAEDDTDDAGNCFTNRDERGESEIGHSAL
ncbi:MAG: hypothetical protein AAF702_14520 [Chloroflexota bacterium]